MSPSSLQTTTLQALSTAAAVVYTTAVTLDSTTAVISSFAGNVSELVADSDNLVRLPQASGIAALVADSATGDAKKPQLISALVGAKDLISLIPTLRGLARQRSPALVLHVPVSSASDVSDVLAVRDSGCAILRSTTQQGAVDYALAASIAAQRLGTPFVHCFPAGASDSIELQGYAAGSTQEAVRAYLQGEKPPSSEAVHDVVSQALAMVVGEAREAVSYFGAADAQVVYVTFGDVVSRAAVGAVAGVGVVQISLARSLSPEALGQAVPASAARVVALEHVRRAATGWGPLFFDLALVPWEHRPILLNGVSSSAGLDALTAEQLEAITAHVLTLASPTHFDAAAVAGIPEDAAAPAPGEDAPSEAATVGAYGQLLRDVFGSRLRVANACESRSIWGNGGRAESTPEFGFGRLAAAAQERTRLAAAVTAVLRDVSAPLSRELHAALAAWLGARSDPSVASASAAAQIGELLKAEAASSPALGDVLGLRAHFAAQSDWLVGGDAWAYDVGGSGVHHVLSSGLNINMLVVDTAADPAAVQRGGARKKDVGLYAMNYGSAYVASVAVYASYAQVLQALAEADAFPGPAVVVAYLPRAASPIAVLQQSKRAVDDGAWPLYRWDPRHEPGSFQLDSEKLRRELADFLKRDSALAAVARATPRLGAAIAPASVEARAGDRLARKARGDVDALVSGLAAGGPPLLVLYASDGGNGEEAARRLARSARRRGMAVRCMGMDEYDFEELAYERTLAIAVSTAGQGEIPTAGREFLKALLATAANLSETAFAVFGLGDSHYWPRPEDAVFYNKPARDLDRRLAELGARRIAGPGLGDDQDADGWEAAFGAFESQLWGALNLDVVSSAADEPEEPPARTDEENKAISNFLRGTIAHAIADTSTGAVDEWDGKLLKFHGTYMQDDRDVRAGRLARGEEKAFSFMIRVRLPGGVATPAQWLAMDALAAEYGNQTMKITTRQTFQLHGVLKRNLRETMRGINRGLMDTIAACGDVNRNVVASANPLQAHLQPEVARLAADISTHLLPATSAYHEIWLADEQVAGSAEQTSPTADYEPLYGPAYLPRKYKIAIAIPPENDVDVFAYDLGYIAILDDAQETILGYNIVIGGGMGMTHNNKATYPRLATCLGYVPKDRAVVVSEKVMLVQRDHGDRSNRKHARLKYTVDDHGMHWWREQVEARLGFSFEPARPYAFTRNGDRYGWTKSTPGLNNFTMFVQNGRVADLPGSPLKTALADVARKHTGNFRLTCNGHLIVADVKDEDVESITRLLASHRLDNLDYSALRLHSMACSERYLPRLIDLLDQVIDQAGLRSDAIVIRMTGCPNGCARPYNAEIAFVGKAPGAYNLYLGGSHNGDRLSKIYRETVTEDQILEALTPIIKQYAIERQEAERFGDFVIRKGIVKATREGKDFHDV
ncbi:Sulfite reductase [NADPH] subunit beta [Coemansia pectinata]|uniref:Sulfite reductase [NADPH] subunit beta n=1 Tax=Coemansia pectinata TaxID=1052879 RepID=A0A9W8GYV7_9FUNG|nr:Sulfite reductase [NADPH] subunit beta [Coemansia pectinata]